MSIIMVEEKVGLKRTGGRKPLLALQARRNKKEFLGLIL